MALKTKISTQIRLDENTYGKTRVIAEKEMRSINAQMEYFIMRAVELYEKENSPINLEPER